VGTPTDSIAQTITFQAAADRYIETHSAGWKNEKHASHWANTLDT
jgi:hypothetical protein